ncbi:MAG: Na-translocating system protein MpsC family protein [Leptolyngbyaceae bacterium]|nr:Na-translocating system protein MpsC family protein [Leptolyngbyaceae bacterium]
MSNLLSNSSMTAEDCLKQSIQDLYVKLFDHSISEITCWSMTEGVVTVVLEDVTTLPERLLIEGGYQQTATLFRRELMQIFKKRLKSVF